MGSPPNITLTAWANLTTADTNGSEIVSLGDHVFLRLDDHGNIRARYYDGSSWTGLDVAKTYIGTGWHHFAAVFDDTNNTTKLYVDGVQIGSGTMSSSISYSGLGANTVIGRHGNADTTHDFTGMIDDVRVYNYALSAAEVIDVYGFIAWWKLDETSGTSAADSSGNSYTGNVTGTVNWTAGVKNNGFNFNGSTKIQATGLLNKPKSFTFAAWANLTTADSNGSEIVSIGNYCNFCLDNHGDLIAWIYDGSVWIPVVYAKTYAGTG